MHYTAKRCETMNRTFRHAGLERYWTRGDESGLAAAHVRKIRRLLDALDVATSPQQMRISGFDYHTLKGPRRGDHAVSVNGNWRITFGWDGTDAININLEDYH